MKSQLKLSTEYKYSKTNIKDLFCTPPYRIMSPFMDDDKMEVCLMSSSAGLLAGDEFDLSIEVADDCHLTFVSQSYEKILDTGDDRACRYLETRVGNNATLKYIPYPAIPFSGSSYESNNVIYLEDTSNLVYSDIFSCGRVGMGERYGLKSFKAHTKVLVEGRLAYADNTIIIPNEIDYNRMGLWGEYTHNGMLYIYSCDDTLLEEIVEKSRELTIEESIFSGVTKCAKGIVIRSLGFSGDEIFRYNKKIASLL